MNYYTKIPFWENVRRINILVKYRELIPKYFNGLGSEDAFGNPDIGERTQRIRQEINLRSSEVKWILLASGINPVVTHYPAPAMGGFVTNINIIDNLFNLEHYDILPISVLDVIDESIGIYQTNRVSSIIRTFNPFFWIWILLTSVASLPFKLLSSAGFNGDKIQRSFWGKIISFIFQAILLIGTLLTILQILGYSNIIASIRSNIDSHLYTQQQIKNK